MTFSKHMQAAQETWMQHLGNTSEASSVIVTTESQSIRREQQAYNASPLGSRIVINHRDVTQDTGYLEKESSTGVQADDVMLSVMSSLKLQLMTRVTLGNCCSNFHVMLKDLLFEGCGSTTTNTFQCLQDHANPRYRVCCAWDKSPDCLARRKDGRFQSYLE
jgi:hypothetical protein